MGVSPWVSDTIANGVQIEWASTPTPFISPEYPVLPDDHAFLETEIQRGLDLGYVVDPALKANGV